MDPLQKSQEQFVMGKVRMRQAQSIHEKLQEQLPLGLLDSKLAKEAQHEMYSALRHAINDFVAVVKVLYNFSHTLWTVLDHMGLVNTEKIRCHSSVNACCLIIFQCIYCMSAGVSVAALC